MLTVGSLFAGIGGFDLGLERTGGFQTRWFCEQDEFCQAVLAKHWPGVPCHPDITILRGADVEPVDVLCGGFPCQDLSYAGKGAGLSGARSGLWSEYARLIGEVGPRYVVVENVSALLARGLGVVLADLSALGYDAEWDCIPASAVGAPHQRDRLWLVAYPERAELRQQPVPVARSGGASLVGVDGPSRRVADADRDDGRPGRSRRPDPSSTREPVAVGPLQDADGPHAASAGLEGAGLRGRPADIRADLAHAEGQRRGAQRPHGAREAWTDDESRSAGQRPREDPWAVEPDVGRVAHGVPARVDRLRALGNALVPQIPEWIGDRILTYEQGRLAHAA